MSIYTLEEQERNAYAQNDNQKAEIIAQLIEARAQLTALYEKADNLISHIKDMAQDAEKTFYFANNIALIDTQANEFLSFELALDNVSPDFID